MKLINKFLAIFVPIIFFFATAYAGEITVETSPPDPVKNESFYVTFKIKNAGDETPVINFVPSGAKVLGKREEGVSISTVVINGRFTTTKEQNYVFELMSSQPNLVIIKNIKVEMGGKTFTHPDLHITIRDMPRRIPDAFMEAQASKTRAFVGEGIDVNYYLYFKTSISANDVKEFPKLNKFIKRFHHINAPVETVQYRGEVMKRILAYSARVYPEKPGPATLDPMTISVQVIQTEYNSPFGGFGLGAQRIKNVDLASKSVAVEVLPLPSEGVPPGFTGLVGEHEFNFTPGKDKYLVNEPIELKLEVRGKGALEKMEAPAIYTENGLEQFDTKGEVTETGNNSAKKVFEYTYLARSALNIKERELSLAYFDPTNGRYIEKKIKIPAISVSGVAAQGASGGSSTVAQKNDPVAAVKDGEDFLTRWFNRLGTSSTSKAPSEKNTAGMVAPDFGKSKTYITRWLDFINIILILGLFLFFGTWYYAYKNQDTINLTLNSEVKKHISLLKKKGLNYSDLYQIVSALDKQNMLIKGGTSIAQIIDGSSLSPEAKEYFKKALDFCEGNSFGPSKVNTIVEYQAKYFNELLKKI